MERSSGILLHVSSLPGPHGIGDLGPAAYEWIDRLAAARQSWWQMLPLGPTGYGDSPYQCFSAFAGNPNFISLERLVEDGLLKAGDIPKAEFPKTEVDYDLVTRLKDEATLIAWRRLEADGPPLLATFEQFCREEAQWLWNFAQFMALKEQNSGLPWWEWPRGKQWPAGDLEQRHQLTKFQQFVFLRQWRHLREYSHQRGIRLIGDMPIFISADSADVWSRPDLFQLDDQRRPKFVAGVPPDYFSATGQLWGNPLYDWSQHRDADFTWWIERLRSALRLVDLVRLDHFRGFEAYWAVPAGSTTAEPGSWVKGPGAELFRKLKSALGELRLIAEDLGVITPEVDALRKQFDLPGMRILQFAFGGAQEDRFLPHRFDHHTVVYTGTHDNETTVGWFGNLNSRERAFFERYAPGAADDPAWTLIRLAWASVADLAITPLQDVLRLGNEARMNLPGTAEGNWRWRVDPALLKEELFEKLAELTTTYQREASASLQRKRGQSASSGE